MPNNYSDYTLEDFILDPDFRKWVLEHDQEADLFWRQWNLNNPQKQAMVTSAKEIIASLHIHDAQISDEEIESRLHEINKVIDGPAVVVNLDAKPAQPDKSYRMWAAAAVLITFLGLAALWYINSKPASGTAQSVVQVPTQKLIEQANHTPAPLKVSLTDGTQIVLSKNASISYSKNYGQQAKREIFLTGEAIFKVIHNSAKPFFVYTNGLATKVLGTSFKINATNPDKGVTVEVISGIVSVYPYHNEANGSVSQKKAEPVVLTRNQKISYSLKDNSLTTSIVEAPGLKNGLAENYNFKNIAVTQIITLLKEGYGIDIVYEEKDIEGKMLTANLTGLGLYQKLNIICRTINCHYEIMSGKIVITPNID